MKFPVITEGAAEVSIFFALKGGVLALWEGRRARTICARTDKGRTGVLLRVASSGDVGELLYR